MQSFERSRERLTEVEKINKEDIEREIVFLLRIHNIQIRYKKV